MNKPVRLTVVVLVLASLLSGCHNIFHRPPGHDPDGPGNSENAPGHNK